MGSSSSREINEGQLDKLFTECLKLYNDSKKKFNKLAEILRKHTQMTDVQIAYFKLYIIPQMKEKQGLLQIELDPYDDKDETFQQVKHNALRMIKASMINKAGAILQDVIELRQSTSGQKGAGTKKKLTKLKQT
jgi:hypothetical protein